MARFRFVHVADLHLDTPFACARAESPKIADALREATFGAWEKVVEVSLENGLALVRGGRRRYLRRLPKESSGTTAFSGKGLEQLNQNEIPVFVTHGNHDPLDSVSASVPPPSNTFVFGAEVETRDVSRNGQLLAQVTGISHPEKNESRNLARLFPPPAKDDRNVFFNWQYFIAMSERKPVMNPTRRAQLDDALSMLAIIIGPSVMYTNVGSFRSHHRLSIQVTRKVDLSVRRAPAAACWSKLRDRKYWASRSL